MLWPDWWLLMVRSFWPTNPMSLGWSVPNFATRSIVAKVYKIWSEVWWVPPRNFCGPKTSKFRHNFDQIANFYGTQWKRKTNCLLIFGELWWPMAKIGLWFQPSCWVAITWGTAMHSSLLIIDVGLVQRGYSIPSPVLLKCCVASIVAQSIVL